jgi:hypothetical protein
MPWLSLLLPPITWSWGLLLLVVLDILGAGKHRRMGRKYQDRIDSYRR